MTEPCNDLTAAPLKTGKGEHGADAVAEENKTDRGETAAEQEATTRGPPSVGGNVGGSWCWQFGPIVAMFSLRLRVGLVCRSRLGSQKEPDDHLRPRHDS